MTPLDSTLGPPRTVGWRGWTALLFFDLLVLALLPRSPLVAAGVLGLLAFAYVSRRPPVAAALATYAVPLFWPLMYLGTSAGTLLLPNLLLLSPLTLLAWGAIWEFPDSGEGTRKLFRALRDPVFVSALLLGLWLALRVLGTPSPMYGRGKTIQYFITNLPLLLAGMVFFGGKEDERARAFALFTRVTLIALAILSLVGIWNLSSHFWPFESRLRVLGVNPIWVARFTGTALLLVLASWGARRLPTLAALPLLALYAVPFYATGSRGPLLALLVALAVWWMLGGRVRLRAIFAAGLALAGGALVAAIGLGWVLIDSPLSGHDASNLARAFFLKTVLDLGSSPGLFGIGTGGFSAAARFGDMRLYPHNIVLELWTETGAIGVALLLLWWTCLLLRTRSAWLLASAVPARSVPLLPSERDRLRVLATVTAFALVNAQVSGDVSGNALLWFWAGVLAAPGALPAPGAVRVTVARPAAGGIVR